MNDEEKLILPNLTKKFSFPKVERKIMLLLNF